MSDNTGTRMTEAQAAKTEARIESLRCRGRHAEADRIQREYWNACDLSPDVRAQLERAAGRHEAADLWEHAHRVVSVPPNTSLWPDEAHSKRGDEELPHD